GIEQAFLGGDQGALAVHMNRPALQYEAVGTITRAALQAENLVGHLIIPVPRPVQAAIEAAPGIEPPVDTAHPALAIGNEGRAGITHPGIIAADFHYPNGRVRSEEHTSELQSRENLVCRLLLEKKKDR